MRKITIATRASQLAIWQAEHIKGRIQERFGDIEVTLREITSRGDKILDKPLALVGGKGHFTKELEDDMLAGNADIAVHSLKDVPTFIPNGLELAAITKREDQSDVLLSHKYASLDDLPEGAIVGTTSLRRRMQILAKRPDLQVKDLRGNVNTRLRKLADGEFDAIILAYIGLKRLELLQEIPYVEKLEFMIPPMGQAALGIEIVSSNLLAREIANMLDDRDTHLCTDIEREFIAEIGAGCSAPVAINAKIVDDEIELRAMIGYPDGTRTMKERDSFPIDTSKDAGRKMARKMIKYGALEMLREAERIAFKDMRPERL